MRRVVVLVVFLIALGVLAPAGCAEATQVKLQLSTNVCELRQVAVFVGGSQVVGKTYEPDPQCVVKDGRDLGTLVIVPSGGGDRFTVTVEGTAQNGSCAAEAGATNKCVTASRVVTFQPHTSLTLPIELDRACLDRMCPAGQTCVRGVCTSAEVDCKTNKTCLSDAGSAEASAGEGGTIDAGAACVSGATVTKPGLVAHHWTFDEATGPVIDVLTNTPAPLVAGYQRFANASVCATALTLGTNVQMPLKVTALPRVALKVRAAIGQFATLVAASNGLMSWELQLQSSMSGLALAMTVTAGPSFSGSTKTLRLPNDLSWHAVEMVAAGNMVDFAIDGKTETVSLTASVPPSPLPLLVGPATGVDIDELWTYAP